MSLQKLSNSILCVGRPFHPKGLPTQLRINMQDGKLNHLLTMKSSSLAKYVLFAIIILILITVGLFIYNNHQTQPGLSIRTVITQSVLEEKYGLRINLIAVTAAGGMLDLRLKILDGEKARLLLQDKNKFPSLLVSSGNIQLDASEDF